MCIRDSIDYLYMNSIVRIFIDAIYVDRVTGRGAFKTREDYTNILSFEILFDPLHKDIANIIVYTTFKTMP